jgi:integrase
MADPTDPANFAGRAKRELTRVRKQVRDANRKDILKTIKKGERGNIPSPKPNTQYKKAWAKTTIRNNASCLRTLAGEVEGLDAYENADMNAYWTAQEGRDKYPDRLLDTTPDQLNELLGELSIERDWGDGCERNYAMSVRNLFLAHGRVDDAKQITYHQLDDDDTAVDIENVPTRKELMLMIDGEHPRDKALQTLMWESGSRVTAMAALKIQHWTPKGDSYGIIQIPGKHVEGLKGAEYSAKPITFARGHLDNWLEDHPLSDDPDAPLFPGIRSQDDPSEHLHPHSIRQQIQRIAERTDGVDADTISPHTFKHGRGTEMRASDRYGKDDIEQVLDWEDGTPMHSRYEHVDEEAEAERILRKHGYDPEDGGDAVQQHDCPRCGQVISAEAEYCPSCKLRQTDGRPRWWRIYRRVASDTDPVLGQYDDGGLPPGSLAELPPAYYDHVIGVFSAAVAEHVHQRLPRSIADDSDVDPDYDVGMDVADDPGLDYEDLEWLTETYPEIESAHQDEHPASLALREGMGMDVGVVEGEGKGEVEGE